MTYQCWLLFFILISLNSPTSSEPMKSIPRESPLDVTSYPIAPSGLILEQIHIYVRHGMHLDPVAGCHNLTFILGQESGHP